MTQVSVAGVTELEAIAKVKTALESQLATGKIVTIDVSSDSGAPDATSDPVAWVNAAGLFADDPTFEDWMEKLAAIRQSANRVDNAA